MSMTIKFLSLIMLLSFTQIQNVMAVELKVLTFKEFQEIKNSPKASAKKLEAYEINNSELISLHRFEHSKKNIQKIAKIKSLTIGKLTAL